METLFALCHHPRETYWIFLINNYETVIYRNILFKDHATRKEHAIHAATITELHTDCYDATRLLSLAIVIPLPEGANAKNLFIYKH